MGTGRKYQRRARIIVWKWNGHAGPAGTGRKYYRSAGIIVWKRNGHAGPSGWAAGTGRKYYRSARIIVWKWNGYTGRNDMKFTKMHGIGNDYVYVNCLEETLRQPEKVAVFVSDRHFGIGSDGLILIRPSKVADFEMAMYNADGSRGMMCGNGIRCVGKYVYDHGLTDKTELKIETPAGIKELRLDVSEGKAGRICVNMGQPVLRAKDVPVESEKEQVINEPVTIAGTSYRMTCISMGNPHCVVFVDDVDRFPLEITGPQFEHHACFPARVNTEFVKVLDRNTVQMRVWERGSGETLACGTGACATAVACILNGYTNQEVTVRLRGGDLDIIWDRQTDLVYMTGTATTVYEGEIELPDQLMETGNSNNDR